MNANDAELLPKIISAIRAFTCATTTEAEQAAAAILCDQQTQPLEAPRGLDKIGAPT